MSRAYIPDIWSIPNLCIMDQIFPRNLSRPEYIVHNAIEGISVVNVQWVCSHSSKYYLGSVEYTSFPNLNKAAESRARKKAAPNAAVI